MWSSLLAILSTFTWLSFYPPPPNLAPAIMSNSLTFTLNNGVEVPWLAFGTGTALYHQNATEAVRVALENGITHLDGAQMYQNEETLGAGIKASGKSRDSIYLVTKLRPLKEGETVRGLLEESLKKLEVEYVDLYLIHTPSPYNKEGTLKAIWKDMEEVQKAGLTKSIGVSNFRVQDLEDLLETATVVPAVNQV